MMQALDIQSNILKHSIKLSDLCWLLDFQDELTLSLKNLQEKVDSLNRIHTTSADMFKYIKVTSDKMTDIF